MEKNVKETIALQMPPAALEFEKCIIGETLAGYDTIGKLADVVKAEYFYSEFHQQIFAVALELYNESKPVDFLTVTDRLKAKGVLEANGGMAAMFDIANNYKHTSLSYACDVVFSKFVQRKIIKMAINLETSARDETRNVDDTLAEAEKSLYELTEVKSTTEPMTMARCFDSLAVEMEESAANGGAGCPSGFKGIDEVTNGWQRSQLIIVAGRPAMGKTAFVISMADRMAYRHDRKVAVFSLEMSETELLKRIVVSRSELEMKQIENGSLVENEYIRFAMAKNELLSKNNLYIDPTPNLTVAQLRSKTRKLKKKHDIDVIVIDYLQLLTGGGKYPNRQEEVAYISRQLKGLAKELKIPIIALSQLSRSLESRPDKTPQLSDLRESGAIEQDADVIAFLHRPEYYGEHTDKNGKTLEPGTTYFLIRKNRRGALSEVPLHFEPRFVRFEDKEKETVWVSARVEDNRTWTERHQVSETIPMPDLIAEDTQQQLPF